jgi:hypothetical protein
MLSSNPCASAGLFPAGTCCVVAGVEGDGAAVVVVAAGGTVVTTGGTVVTSGGVVVTSGGVVVISGVVVVSAVVVVIGGVVVADVVVVAVVVVVIGMAAFVGSVSSSPPLLATMMIIVPNTRTATIAPTIANVLFIFSNSFDK